MKAVGIICELNPFHAGHRYLIEEAKLRTGADAAVLVMSGNFTQRGRPAVQDKWCRARDAVRGGADLVLEMPQEAACASAQDFASSGVRILEGLGTVQYLAFGSESGDLAALSHVSSMLMEHQEEIEKKTRLLLREGRSYPGARESAVREIDPSIDGSILREPNNLLALEYLTAVRTLIPVTVKRKDAGYHQTGTALRQEIIRRNPARFRKMEQRLFAMLAYRIRMASDEELDAAAGAKGGLGRKAKKALLHASSLDSLAEAMKSRAYTRTRIDRFLTHILLGIREDSPAKGAAYARPLAMGAAGQALLRRGKETGKCRLPVIMNPRNPGSAGADVASSLRTDVLAQDLYNLACGEELYSGSDFVRHPEIIQP